MSVVEFQTMPPLSSEEYQQLEASILEQGIQVPVIVDERGVVIDGHHRERIASEHGIHMPTEVRDGLTEAQKVALSISLNVNRRQLSREQRREIIAASLKAEPAASDREHARRTGASDKTVTAVRESLESTAEIPQLDRTVGADGKERPASRPVVKHSETTTTKDEWVADAETGEVIDEPAPPAPKPAKPRVLEGDALKDFDARKNVLSVSNALQTLDSMRTPAHRDRVINTWWPRAARNEEVPPWGRDLFQPEPIRQIAQALNSLANELEDQS